MELIYFLCVVALIGVVGIIYAIYELRKRKNDAVS